VPSSSSFFFFLLNQLQVIIRDVDPAIDDNTV
jgi:hypothetical protein